MKFFGPRFGFTLPVMAKKPSKLMLRDPLRDRIRQIIRENKINKNVEYII